MSNQVAGIHRLFIAAQATYNISSRCFNSNPLDQYYARLIDWANAYCLTIDFKRLQICTENCFNARIDINLLLLNSTNTQITTVRANSGMSKERNKNEHTKNSTSFECSSIQNVAATSHTEDVLFVLCIQCIGKHLTFLVEFAYSRHMEIGI